LQVEESAVGGHVAGDFGSDFAAAVVVGSIDEWAEAGGAAVGADTPGGVVVAVRLVGCKVGVDIEVDTGCMPAVGAEGEVVQLVVVADRFVGVAAAAAAVVVASDFGVLRTHNSRTKPIVLGVDVEVVVLAVVQSTDLAAEQLRRPNTPNNQAAVVEEDRVAAEVVGNLESAQRDFCAY
jgi:hypothetical protein